MEKKQDPIVFIHSISSYFNYLGSVKDVLKWSQHGHITIFQANHGVEPQKYFLQTNNFKFSSKKTHYFRDELTRPIINTNLLYNSQKSYM